jgi:hypothetical protein
LNINSLQIAGISIAFSVAATAVLALDLFGRD